MRALVLALAACSTTPAALTGSGTRLAGEDALFHQQPRWLGGDAAYTIDLGDGRVLWLFGDSFIATSPALVRSESTMVHNSVAVMTGDDPASATMQFAWRDGAPPDAFFAEDGDDWFWPNGGVRVPGGPLVVFVSEVRATPGQGLGFASAGYRAVMVADPSGPPDAWQLAAAPVAPAPYDPTATVACAASDGDHLVALLVDGQGGAGRLARWAMTDVAAGDLSTPGWWTGTAWSTTAATAAVVLPDASTECSLERFADQWLLVASHGFGASTIAIYTAPAVTGPWSDPRDVFTPPESEVPDAFVYAGKGHPALVTHTAGASLVVTYADNSFTFSDLLDPANADTLYWPHVAELSLR